MNPESPPIVTRINVCECCRRALRPDEFARKVCVDCCGISGVAKRWRTDRHWTGWDNAALDGLSTPIGKLPGVTARVQRTPEQLDALAELIRKT